jgi:hypothetical protein
MLRFFRWDFSALSLFDLYCFHISTTYLDAQFTYIVLSIVYIVGDCLSGRADWKCVRPLPDSAKFELGKFRTEIQSCVLKNRWFKNG